MAWRHGQHGGIGGAAIWKCPTCGTANSGPLEGGCASCKAGADAKARGQAETPRHTVSGRSPFEHWVEETYENDLDTAGWSIASAAWDAGVKWAQGRSEPLPPGVTVVVTEGEGEAGGWTVELVAANAVHHVVDPQTQNTIVAALAFYRDNQLAYGAVPGQLSAMEVSELIEKLLPKEQA